MRYNIRSYKENSRLFLPLLDNETFNPEGIVLTEAWATQQIRQDVFAFNRYYTLREPWCSGGVSIYIRDRIDSRALENLCFADRSFEICTVKVDSKLNARFLLDIYEPLFH